MMASLVMQETTPKSIGECKEVNPIVLTYHHCLPICIKGQNIEGVARFVYLGSDVCRK